MHVFTTVAFAALVVSALVADAPVVNNVPGAHYIAHLLAGGSRAIIAQIAAETPTNSSGVLFTINVNGYPQFGGPFLYHVHEMPVPANGSCAGTGGHLNPYGRADTPTCDASQPQTCQVGDLSGKHGNIDTLPGFSTQYIDQYLSLTLGTPAFIGNRSFVIHYKNGTRLACANFKLPITNTTATNSSNPGAAASSAFSSVTGTAAPTATKSPTASANPSSPAVPRAVAPAVIDKIHLGPLLAAIAFAVGFY